MKHMEPIPEEFTKPVERLIVRLVTVILMGMAACLAYLAAGTAKPPWWLWLMAMAVSIWVTGRRTVIGGAVVVVAAASEWLFWTHGPGLHPLPATFATLLAPAMVLGVYNLWKPCTSVQPIDANDSATFLRQLAIGAPLLMVWLFGWGKTL